uniref:ATP-dependent RNA helicase n=1 Tax=Rousettus aegyptiacus TaxID=9407 RepID=A0A7J8IHZ3_ROUAE|nr:DEAD-box helicase 31 [Rousettus aegyptiacus]
MAVTDGLLLHLSEPPAAAAAFRTFSRPRVAQAKRQAQATKRKYQASSAVPPAKRRSRATSLPAKKTAAGGPRRAPAGRAQTVSSPRKSAAGGRGRNQEQKPCVKTSSLFKNNPEIPELHRPVVHQVQEKVFSSGTFHDLGLHPHLVSTINTVLNMFTMTSVQMHSIPALLEGKDALVRSQTGSGKTLAYCIPVVQSLQAMKTKIQRSDGPYALVLVPTRELVLQSFDTFQKLLKPFTWIVPGVLMGGEKRKSEKARLRKGINILISTPGRLVDHIKSTKNIHFSRIQWLILDEADRLLDLGFEKDITAILNAVNAEGPERQNVLLSATLTDGVARLADVSLNNPVSISVAEEGPALSNPEGGGALDVSAPQTGDKLDSFAIPEGLDQYVTLVPSKRRNALRERETPGKAYEGRDPPESCSKLFLPRTAPVAPVALDRCPALVTGALGHAPVPPDPDDGRPCDGAATGLVSRGEGPGVSPCLAADTSHLVVIPSAPTPASPVDQMVPPRLSA